MECDCDDWKEGMEKINGPIEFMQARGTCYSEDHFIKMYFCPWCGENLIDPDKIMTKYDEDIKKQKFVVINHIEVPSEYDKKELLLAIEYLHARDIDTDYMAVNTLTHLYQYPEKIIIKEVK